MTITIPPDLAERLTTAAAARGTRPEWVAYVTLINAYPPPLPPPPPGGPKKLLELLGDIVGSVEGTGEPHPTEMFVNSSPAAELAHQ